MPYATAWDSNRPPGSTAAKNIDDEIRLLRQQLEERLEDVLITDITADPWVLKDNVKGVKTGIQRIIPFSSFLNDLHARENDINTDGYLFGFVDGGHYIANLDVPVGCVVTKLEYLTDKGTTGGLVCQFKRKSFAAGSGAAVVIDTTNVNVAGAPSLVPSPDLNVPLVGDQYYYIDISGTGTGTTSFRIFAVRVTFNRDSVDHAS